MQQILTPQLLNRCFDVVNRFNFDYSKCSQKFIKKFEDFKFQKFSQPEISQIIDQLSKNNMNASFPSNIRNKSQFNPSLLNNLIDFNDENDLDFIANLSIYSFFVWIANGYELDNAQVLTESLIISMKSQYYDLLMEIITAIFDLICSTEIIACIIDNAINVVYQCSSKCNYQALIVFMLKYIINDEGKRRNFVKKLIDILERNSNYFSDDSIFQISILLMKSFEELDHISLSFLYNSREIIPEKIAQIVIPNFPISILKYLKCNNMEPILNLSTNEEINNKYEIASPNFNSIKADFGFSDCLTLPDGFDPYYSINFPKILDLHSIFPHHLSKSLALIAKCVRNNENYVNMLVTFFFNTLETLSNDKTIYINLFISLLYVCNEIDPRMISISTENALKFFDTYLFDYTDFQNTIFPWDSDSQKKEFDPELFREFIKINTFRNMALDYILSDDGSAICKILISEVSHYPYFLAELFFRLANKATSFSRCISLTPKLIKTITNLSLLYQHFEMKDDTNEANKAQLISAIRKVRISIFVALAHLFSDQNMIKLFFEDPIFLNSFFTFVFEEPVRPFILSSLSSYLTRKDSILSDDFASIFYNILKIVESQLPGHRQLLLLKDMVKAFDNCLQYHIKELINFGDFSSLLCQSMAKVPNNKLSKDIFKFTLSFLMLISPFFEIGELEIDALISCLSLFNDIDYDLSLLNTFISVLAGQPATKNHQNFIICQPQILKLLIQIFLSTPKFKDVINFCYDLCNFSPKNLNQCSKIKLDLFLLKYLEKTKLTGQMSESLVQSILDLYSLLSLNHSSYQSVLRFISLLSPIDSIHISKYHLLFINILDKMIIEASKQPKTTFPLTKKTKNVECHIHNKTLFQNVPQSLYNTTRDISKEISLSHDDNCFYVTFWIFIESNHIVCRRIFTLSVGDGMKIGALLSNSSLYIFTEEGNNISTNLIGAALNMHTWTFCVLSFAPNGKRIIINYILKQQSAIDTIIKNKLAIENFEKCFSLDNPSLVLGGYHPQSQIQESEGELNSRENQITSSKSSQLGAFGLYKKTDLLNLNSFLEIESLGLRNNSNPPIEYIAYINDYSEFDNTVHDGFVDILIDKCGVKTILPLFLQTNLQTFDGSTFNMPLEIILNLLNNILTYSVDAQINFYRSKGFNIIAQLLTERWTPLFTLKTNSQLYQLLISMQCEQLQQQIFDEVMTNFTFMQLLPPELHLRIMKHWQNLFASFPNIAQNFSSFEDIISVMRMFYWYKPVEPRFNKYEKIRAPNLNVEEIRRIFFNILFKYALECFQLSDFECLVSHCLSCSEMRQVYEMTSFIIKIFAEVSKEKIEFNVECKPLAAFIYHFMQLDDDKMKKNVIELLLVCHQNSLISDKFFHSQIIQIIEILPMQYVTKEFYNFLIENLEIQPLLFDLCCYLSLHFKNISFIHNKKLINSLKIKFNQQKKYPLWAVLPICVAINVDPSIIDFILDFSHNDIEDIFAQYDLFFESSSVFEEEFSNRLYQKININSNNIENQIDIFEICERLIAFKKRLLFSSYEPEFTINMDEPSIKYYDPEIQYDSKSQNLGFKFVRDLFKQKIEIPQFQFRLKFINNRADFPKWKHKELAISLLKLFETKFTQSFLPFDIILCSFLQATEYDGVFDHLNNIDLKSKDTSECEQVIIPLLSYHTMHANKQMYFNNPNSSLSLPHNPLLSYQNFNMLLDQITPKRYINKIKSIFSNFEKYKEYLKNSINISEEDISFYVDNATKQLQQFLDRQQFQNDLNKRSWRRLWSSLSSERAPWNIPDKSNCNLYYRDLCPCFAMAPVKIFKRYIEDLGDNAQIDTFSKRGIIAEEKCIVITPGERKNANFELYDSSIMIYLSENKIFTIPTSSLTFVLLRKDNGIQIFTDIGYSFLLEFAKLPTKILNLLSASIPPKKHVIFQRPDNIKLSFLPYISQWKCGRISNYEYLLMLNHFLGKSFNDIDNYPIFPCIFKTNVINSINSFDDILNEPQKYLRTFNNNNVNENQISSSEHNNLISPVLKYLSPIDSFGILLNKNENEYQKYKHINSFEELVNYVNNFNFEFIPEFYSMPELFKANKNECECNDSKFSLPKWASSPIDFVYKHRKLLELPYISKQLHIWINKAFQFYFTNENHPQIEKSVLNKENHIDPILKNPLEFMTLLKAVDEAIIIEIKPLIFRIWLLFDDGKIGDCSLNLRLPSSTSTMPRPQKSSRTLISRFSNADISEAMSTNSFKLIADSHLSWKSSSMKLDDFSYKSEEINLNSIDNSFLPHQHSATQNIPSLLSLPTVDLKPIILGNFDQEINDGSKRDPHKRNITNKLTSSCNNMFIVVSKNGKINAYDIHSQKKLEVDIDNSFNISSVASDGIWHVFGSENASISLLRELKDHSSIQLYRDAVNTCAVSQTFNIIACGTREGSLIICSITKGSITKAVNLSNTENDIHIIPKRIIITKSWGFIVVYCDEIVFGTLKHSVNIFTVNGDLIRKSEINIEIDYMSSFTSYSGFDYIIYATKVGHVFFDEAIYLKPAQPIYSCRSGVVSTHFSKDTSTLVIISREGQIHFLPLVVN